MTDVADKINLSYWFPLIKQAGLPVPETRIVTTGLDLMQWLDAEPVVGSKDFLAELQAAADEVGYPCFLRTGHISGKHDWKRSCYVPSADDLPQHVFTLVDLSGCMDIVGLPVDTWVVRKLIPTKPLFTAFHGDMPITREFRFFVRDGAIDHVQPYWPEEALTGNRVSNPEWASLLADASELRQHEYEILSNLAMIANSAVPGFWSVDFLEDENGFWWLTDMAPGDVSYRWEPETPKWPGRK